MNFNKDQLEIKYDPTRYESASKNPQVMFVANNIGIRLPSKSFPTVNFGWSSNPQVLEQLLINTTWTLQLDNTGLITVVSPTDVKYSHTFTELSGDISAMRIGLNDFSTDTTVTNCYRVFNPSQITGIGGYEK